MFIKEMLELSENSRMSYIDRQTMVRTHPLKA